MAMSFFRNQAFVDGTARTAICGYILHVVNVIDDESKLLLLCENSSPKIQPKLLLFVMILDMWIFISGVKRIILGLNTRKCGS